MKKILIFIICCSFYVLNAQQKTYCNPINIDYGYTPFEVFSTQGKHRATADPVIVNFKGNYFLFSTNQEGYWWSDNMLNWNFVYRKFLLDNKYTHDLNAPGVFAMKDTLYVYGSTHEKDFPIWKSTNPTKDDWKIAVDTLKVGAWDPGFLFDEALDKLFLYWGSSNEFPLLGTELNTKTLQSDGLVKPLMSLHPQDHGWERFGEFNDNTFLQPFIEGAWVTKYNNKYYLQYGAPATEFSGYADGVYVSDKPLEGFSYQSHNPFAYKPGGFARGAGHGATYQDNFGNWWHISTVILGQKNNFERRIGIWPSGFDKDDVMYCNTAYGDYPTFLPQENANHIKGLFTGWMLLNYNKPVQVSTTLGGYHANNAVDEDLKTYWSAKTGDKGEWFQTDLGEVSTINAIQINYADQDAEFEGKSLNVYHQYKIYSSNDGKKWNVLVDKSKNKTDVPHDYIELVKPAHARYIKLENLHMPTGKFALSGFRIFGKGVGEKPESVEDFMVLRADAKKFGERRSSWIRWKQNDKADGYVIYFGKDPDKLYGSIMVYNQNDYFFTGMDRVDSYYFQIEAFNENGISKKTELIFVE
ncbi:MAG: xylosidase [Flavobacteriales bacterium]|nr:xylosidase [Flavobacteriia bacterium]NCP06472.1 xylosidase [Flavobacteriales bacterium]PIV93118.1 MAG: xylosidase [Flavobacteriaceae bacterium CG17_big_fil_post_rev_8_21_14_2_50_33_15]PIY11541.1 MAG: xylosidase [Flavobacteriaceae bacterium CG_4_10_14_3_um_filter_33_47]PJB18848.1 MAG: xylosidase [Flavobacteriaceae bacterium CG_4_9_14_3_um_filter_33_16]